MKGQIYFKCITAAESNSSEGIKIALAPATCFEACIRYSTFALVVIQVSLCNKPISAIYVYSLSGLQSINTYTPFINWGLPVTSWPDVATDSNKSANRICFTVNCIRACNPEAPRQYHILV